jgi:HK97 gp10 family phage protein
MSTKVELKTQWHGNEVKIQGKQVINKSSYEVGLVVEGQAKLLAPRDYGYLAASITTQSNDKGTELEAPGKYSKNKYARGSYEDKMVRLSFKKITKSGNENEVLVGTPLFYGPYQEFGTIRAPAQPFLRPALDMAQGKVLTIVKINSKYYFKGYLK